MLELAFKNISPHYSIMVPFPYGGDPFDLLHLKSKTKTLTKYIWGAQYANGIAIFTNDDTALQYLLFAQSNIWKKMGLRINMKKTETINVGEEVDFFIDGHKLEKEKCFKYLGH